MSEKDVIKETRPRMDTVIEDFRRKLATVRTGRAAVSLLDSVMVDYYGTLTPLNQMASVHAPEPADVDGAALGPNAGADHRKSHPRLRPWSQPFK